MKRARHRRRAQATSFHPAGRSGSTITTSAAPAASAFQSLWVYSSVCAGLALAVFIVYTPGLSHDFVNFDDPQYVVENPHVRSGLTWRGVGWALTATHAGNWHPVTWWSHMLDVELFGLNPQGHHASSVLIHLVNTLLLFTLLDRMTRQVVPSALVAALFGVHPLHVESVAWIAERKDVLSTLFALLTIQAYVSYAQTRSRSRYALTLGWFVTGLATKPMLVTLPFVLLLLDFWPLRRLARSDSGIREGHRVNGTRAFRSLLLEKLPFLACTLVSSVVTYMVQHGAGAVRDLAVLPMTRRLATAAVAYAMYIAKTIWPARLAPLYPYSSGEPPWLAAVAALLLASLTVLALRAARRIPYVTVGWLWFAGTLVPVIGLVQVGSQPMADRYMYFPVVGLFIVFAWGLTGLHGRTRGGRGALVWAMAAVVVVNMVAARRQVTVWASSIDLWEHTLGVTRDNYRAHNNLAHALGAAGRAGEATAHYEAALRLNPDSVDARTGIAARLASDGRLDEAIEQYRHALKVRPGDATAHANLGAALTARGQIAEAEVHLRKAADLAPDTAAVHRNLGIALARTGRTAEAVTHFSKAVNLQPDDAAAHRHLGAALTAEGRISEAIATFEAAIRLDPADPLSRNAYGAALVQAGRLESAAAEYEEAVRLQGAFAEARANLGNLLARLGRTDEAEIHLREAVRLEPRDSASRYDLAVALVRQGREAKAREQLETLLREDPAYEAAREMLSQLTRGAIRPPERRR